ncbi:MFS transporter [Termitidicoccus mucosus]|uniref:Major facilitator superfamily (MFS) profile domain-containing protein n=1 Tax=Termitidicoccus mucosus TaxID=1184151 RepID=A0A178IIN0_9BACT|nr:hypothetical protein AW736_10605 [Opitutaceae bacterium TSB47]
MPVFQKILASIRTHRRWTIIGLLFGAAVVNGLDRQTLSVLAPTLREKLGFGSVEYSYIATSFLVAYTIGYTFCGRVLDRLGVKLGLAIALAFWSLAGVMHAFATGWLMLAVCRFMLGLGESFNSPSAVKAVADWVPVRERGLSMAISSNGNVMGAILAPPLVSFVAIKFGWQWGFIATGLAGFVLLAVWWKHFHSPEKHPAITKEEREYIQANRPQTTMARPKVAMWALLAQPICLGFFVTRLMTDSITYFFSFWLPDYLTHSRGFTLAMIGLFGWLPFLASDIGGPGGGALSDWLVRRGWNSIKARRAMMLFAACLMPLANVAARTDSAWVALALIGVLLAAQSCWMANQLTLISESVPRENVGTLLALSALGGSLGGICSTLLTGRILATYGYVPVFTGLSVMHLLAFAFLTWSQVRQQRRDIRAA